MFFDWLNTLAHPEPERHEIYLRTYREFGIELDLKRLASGISTAENLVAEGNPVKWRESGDNEPCIRYQEVLLSEFGIRLPREKIAGVVSRLNYWVQHVSLILYDDVIPTFEELKQRGLILGLLTNMPKGFGLNYRELGLEPYLDVVVTSEEAGANKPKPPIFRLALERAGVGAAEAVYVGDQYGTDVIGAKGVDIKPVLIDRFGFTPEVADCERITSLSELGRCL